MARYAKRPARRAPARRNYRNSGRASAGRSRARVSRGSARSSVQTVRLVIASDQQPVGQGTFVLPGMRPGLVAENKGDDRANKPKF